MGCHVVKSIASVSSQPQQQQHQEQHHQQPNNRNYRETMDKDNKPIADTQPLTESQSTNAWTNIMDSQPIEKVVWGRLYPKSVQLKSLDLCDEMFAAGRDEANDVCLTKRQLPEKILCRISKVHFQITKDLTDVTNPVYIEDLSRNGTFLNGERIGHKQRQILLNDDIISLSHREYKAFVYKDLGPNETHGLPPAICKRYHIGRKLGAGACGVVRLVYDRRTCKPFAMKHIRKNQMMSAQQRPDAQRIANEGKIMRSLRHPCVVQMHSVIDSADSVFLVLEVMHGGDLLSRIIGSKRLSERTAKLYMVQLCHAVKYLHDKNITHRDLKPDNVLLQSSDEETLLKVSDFGLSKAVNDDSVMRTLCGTPLYVAPEVLLTGGRGSYTKKVDVWSLGVVLFTCLSGTLPFSDDYGSPASEQIKKGAFRYASPAWRAVSEDAKSLIGKMLTVRADKRLDIDEVLASGWLQDAEMLRRAEKIMGVSLVAPKKVAAAAAVTVLVEKVIDVPPELPLQVQLRRAMRLEETTDGRQCVADAVMTIGGEEEVLRDQENVSANFLQPPAAKRRRIEQM